MMRNGKHHIPTQSGVRILVLATLTLLALSVRAPSAEADVTCGRVGPDLTVTVTDGFASRLVMDGAFIDVYEGPTELTCGGDPTASNVDTVIVNDLSGAALDTSSEIDLSGGPFAPGQSGEAATPEIEFQLAGVEMVDFEGSASADDLRFGSAAGAPKANLNGAAEGTGVFADVDVTFTGLDRVRIDSGLSGDLISGQGATLSDSPFNRPMTLLGEEGGDDLRGGDSDDNIGFSSEVGSDELVGGAGDDRLVADSGDDELDGGPGTDAASYVNAPSAVAVDLAVSAQQNTGGGGLDTLTSVESLLGSTFADSLRGNAAANRLEGLAGGDLVEGRGGSDAVLGDSAPGDAGNDTLLVRDGVADTVICLGGADSVTTDLAGVDSVPVDCESVSFTPSSEFTFGRLMKNKQHGTAKQMVSVLAPGELVLAGSKQVKGQRMRVNAPGRARLRISPKGAVKRGLAASGHGRLRIAVTFTADGGAPATRTATLRLVKSG